MSLYNLASGELKKENNKLKQEIDKLVDTNEGINREFSRYKYESKKEIERLNNIIFNQNKRNSHQRIANDNLQNKNKELNNIINEIEKWLKYEISKSGFEQDYEIKSCYEDIFEELQELKGSDKE